MSKLHDIRFRCRQDRTELLWFCALLCLVMITRRQLTAVYGWPRVTYVPLRGTVNTRSSDRRMSRARSTVSLPTSYVSCSCLIDGSGPVRHSPAVIRSRRMAANCR